MNERDETSKEQLRRRMLNLARLDGAQHQDRWVPAASFLRATDDQGSAIASEAECAALLEDLLGWGLLEEAGELDLGGAKKAFRHRRFRRTQKAHALWTHQIDPIPGVADERLGD